MSQLIADYTLQFDQDNYYLVYGTVLEEERECWWCYPPPGNVELNRTLVFNYQNNAWYEFSIGYVSLGYYYEQDSITWENVDKTWEEMDREWVAKEYQAGYPITLGGDASGNVYRLNDTESDRDNGAISFELRTKELNPFWEQGYSVRLGFLDLYFLSDPDSTITIEVYDHENDLVLESVDVLMEGNVTNQRSWYRVPFNVVGQTLQLRIKQNATGQDVQIHAIVPWMAPAGRHIW